MITKPVYSSGEMRSKFIAVPAIILVDLEIQIAVI
jgi:hypothetical protein